MLFTTELLPVTVYTAEKLSAQKVEKKFIMLDSARVYTRYFLQFLIMLQQCAV